MLEPITPDIEQAAQQVLEAIDCQNRIVKDSEEGPASWSLVREAWRSVALALVADARLDWKKDLFERRLKALEPFSDDDPDVAHRMRQERCLWAVYSLDFESLNELLDVWHVEDSDPIWMLRKAALLTEARRHDHSRPLVRTALNRIRRTFSRNSDIASASREGWALGSTLTTRNSQGTWRRWAELASHKADAWTEKTRIADGIRDAAHREEVPSFDLGVRRSADITISNAGYARLVAAYKAVRLPEVAGLPPVNNPESDSPVPMATASDILSSAADRLISVNPELAMRLALRVCTSDRDKTLERVLSRTRIATLSEESLTTLAHICIGVINYALPRLSDPYERVSGVTWMARMIVSLEALSRFAMRLPPDLVIDALEVGIKCYQMEDIAQDLWLGQALGNLLSRSWKSLPEEHRTARTLSLLKLPIYGRDGIRTGGDRLPDPGEFISAEDVPPKRTCDNEAQYQDVIGFLIRELQKGGGARQRAIRRLIPLVFAGGLTDAEESEIANALWKDSDPIHENSSRPRIASDWVYLILPELEEGQADKSFRSRWLSTREETEDGGQTFTSETLAQVGAAISGMKARGKSFPLTHREELHVAVKVEQLVDMFFGDSVSIGGSLMSGIHHLGTLASEITLPKETAENLLERVQLMLGPGSDERGFFTRYFNDLQLEIGYALIPGLMKSIPDQFESLSLWLRIGLASGDDRRVGNAMSAIRTWLSAAGNKGMQSVPEDIVREIGYIIASRRRTALVDALWCAEALFEEGAKVHQDTIRDSVLRGLEYLTEELRYDRDHNIDEDVPLLRLLCVQLARALAKHRSDKQAVVAKWLEIGEKDPFPEVRAMARPSAS